MICYKGIHLFHTFCAVFFSVMFITISIIVAINFYESRISSDNPLARKSSHGEVIFIMNKIVLQLSFALFKNQTGLVLVMFIGACFTAYYNIVDDPYYDKKMATFFKIIALVYWWSNFMVFILLFVHKTGFQGGMIVWMIGLPFIIICGFAMSQDNLSALIKTQIKFKDDDDLLDHLKLILLLIKRHEKDKESHLLLVGYIQKHQEICMESDCPLKTGNRKNVSLIDMEETIARLIKVIERLYISGIKKFKRSIRLRISYAFFLMEKLNLKKKALEQLSQAENFNPSFEEEFLIYRYKKIIEDNIGEDNRNSDPDEVKSEVDIVGMIAFDSHMKFCIYFIKQAAEYNKLYWLELLRDAPSLEVISNIGYEMDLQITKAKENWMKLSKMITTSPIIIKLFSKFLISVLNEQEEGQELLKRFSKIVTKNLKIKQLDISDIHEIDSTLIVAVISSNLKQMGKIKKVSSSFCSLFGYSEVEILSKSYSCIFPDIYTSSSQNFINSIMKNAHLKTSYFGNDKSYYAKLKNGSVIPIVSNVRIHSSSNITFQDFIYLNIITPVADKYPTALVIVNKNGYITDGNSLSQLVINYPVLDILSAQLKIQLLLPKVLVSHKYRNQGKKKMIPFGETRVLDMDCIVTPIQSAMKATVDNKNNTNHLVDDLLGFTVAMVPDVYQKTENQISRTQILSQNKFKNIQATSIWEFVKPALKIDVLEEKKKVLRQRKPSVFQKRISSDNNDLSVYGGDIIVTKQLQLGKIVDYAEQKFYITENEEFPTKEDVEFNKSIFRDNVQKLQMNELNEKNIIRKNLLKKIMIKESKNPFALIFQVLAIIWVVVCIILIIIILLFATSKINKFQKNTIATYQGLNIVKLSSNLAHNLYKFRILEEKTIQGERFSSDNLHELEKLLNRTNVILDDLVSTSMSLFQIFPDSVLSQIHLYTMQLPLNKSLSHLPESRFLKENEQKKLKMVLEANDDLNMPKSVKKILINLKPVLQNLRNKFGKTRNNDKVVTISERILNEFSSNLKNTNYSNFPDPPRSISSQFFVK